MPSIDTHSADGLLSHKDENENEYSLPETPRKRRYKKTVLWISLCALVLSVLVTTYSLSRSRNSRFIPIISNRQVTWEPDNRFDANPDRNSAWTEMMPRGKGFVKVPIQYQQGLGPGRPMDDGSGEYCLSVFHQLHCLATLRSALNSLRYGDNSSHGDHDDHPVEHADHCIDYLRQAVMCSGDMTLEHFPVLENGKLEPFVDGWSVTHQCKNWDEIMQFTNDHRSSNVRAID